MRVTVVLPAGSTFDRQRPNAIEAVVHAHAAFAPYDVDLTVICDGPGGDGVETGVERLEADLGGKRRLRAIVPVLARLQPDIVEVHQHLRTANFLARCSEVEAPVAFYRHGVMARKSNMISRLLAARKHRRIAARIFVSRFLRDHVREEFPEWQSRDHIVPNFADPAFWWKAAGPRPTNIAFCGRAVPEKGFDLFCAAMVQVLAADSGCTVTLCASEWERQAPAAEPAVAPLRAFPDRFRLVKNATPEQVRDTLHGAAIAVVPTVAEEAFGLSALETHLAGCALVSSGTGALRDISGGQARFLDTLDADGIAKACLHLLAEPDERSALAASGQRFALQDHVPQRAADALDHVRRSLITAPGER